ncbi:(Fe-S)-binding protein [Thiovibrio sp. JS02]
MSDKPRQCAKCGACTVVCPVFRAGQRESLSARGRLHLLTRFDPAEASEAYAEILSRCLLCGACRPVCSRGLDPADRFSEARSHLTRSAGRNVFLRAVTQRALASPGLLSILSTIGLPLLTRLPAESGLRIRLGLPAETEPALHPAGDERPTAQAPPRGLAYFAGCYAGHLQRGIARATEKIALAGGQSLFSPPAQHCCGLAAESAGDLVTARRLAKANINAFADGDLPILTSCASCYSQLRRYPRLLADDPLWRTRAAAFAGRLLEFSSFVATAAGLRFAGFPRPCRVFYHDPCHLRFHARISAEPRAVLQGISNLDLREPTDGPRCCGQGGLFHLAQPELARTIRGELLSAIAATGAEEVVTTCSGCLLHLGAGLTEEQSPAKAKHLAVFLAERL